jgi:hypothetical protein
LPRGSGYSAIEPDRRDRDRADHRNALSRDRSAGVTGSINLRGGFVASAAFLLVPPRQAEGYATDALGVNNGIIQGIVGFVPGRVRQAFGFASSGDVLVPDSPSLGPAALTVWPG